MADNNVLEVNPPTEGPGPASWTAAAQPAAPPAAPPAPAGGGEPSPAEAALRSAQNPDRGQAQAQSASTTSDVDREAGGMPAIVMRPAQGGLLGVVNKVLDAVVGTQRPEIYNDQHGNEYVYHPNLSRGEQWARLGATLGRGAAAGFAAGRGSGGGGRAALAGFATADQAHDRAHGEENEMEQKVRQDTLDQANMQMLQMQMAEEGWKAGRLKVTASQEDMKFNDYQVDRIKADGGEWIGDATHPGDIAGILQTTPNVMEHMVKTGQLRIQPKLDPDGAHMGIQAYLMPAKYGKEILPAGAEGHTYNSVTKQMEPFHYSDPVSKFQRDVHEAQAWGEMMKAQTEQATLDQKQEEVKKTKADTAHTEFETSAGKQKLPGEIAHTAAETDAANALAAVNNAKATMTKKGDLPTLEDGSIDWSKIPPLDIKTARQIGKGDQKLTELVGRGSPEYRRYWMQLTEAVDPSFTQQKFQARQDLLTKFVAREGADQIVSFNQFVSHVQRLNDGIQAMRNSGSPLLNMPMNKWKTYVEGHPEVSRQMAPLLAARTEFQNFLNNNHALHQSDKDEGLKLMNENMAPAQMQDNSRSMLDTAANRFIDLNNEYYRGFGQNFPGMLDKSSAQTLRTFGLSRYVNQLSVMGEDAPGQQGPGQQPPAPAAPAAWAPPPNAPPVPVANDQYLYDGQGKPVAKSQGGKWVQP